MKKNMKIIFDQEEPKKYEIFCSFDSDLTKKSYVLFTDYCEDGKGQLLLHAGKYEQIDEDTLKVDKKLDKLEYEMVSEIMNKLIENAKKNF